MSLLLGEWAKKLKEFVKIFLIDVDVARCFRRLNVYPNISIDDEGKERFHPLSISHHFNGEFPDWLYQYASNPAQKVSRYFISELNL